MLRNLDMHSEGAGNLGTKQRETVADTASSGKYLEKKVEIEKDKKSFVTPDQQQMKIYNSNLFPSSCDPDKGAEPALTQVVKERQQRVLTYLRENRMLSDYVLQKYQVGWTLQQFLSNETDKKWVDHICVTFPWIMAVQDDVSEEEAVDADSSDEDNVRYTCSVYSAY